MSLPPELDFDRDREASPARMNRAMEYIFLRLAAATALQPEFETAIRQIQAVGLERLDEVLGPILVDATDVAGRLSVIRDTWLGSEPLMAATAALTAQVTARLAANSADVAAQLAANAAAVAAQLVAVDTKLGQLSPTAKWAEANTAEARAGTASRLLSAAIWWAMRVPVALVDAATIAVPAGVNYSVTLRGNRTLALPADLRLGQAGFVRVAQDATGGRTLAFAAGYRADATTLPALDAAPGSVTVLRYEVTGDGEVTLSGGKPPLDADPRQETVFLFDGNTGLAKSPYYWFAPAAQSVALRAVGGAVTYARSTAAAPGTYPANARVEPGATVTVALEAGAVLRVGFADSTNSVDVLAHLTRV